MRRCGGCSGSRPSRCSDFLFSLIWSFVRMAEKIPLLVLNSLSEVHQAQVAAVYDMTYLPVPSAAERAALIAAEGARFRAVLTIGSIGLSAEEMAAMPKLE